MPAHVPHVVIVGGGFGGLNAARALKRAPVRVTLIDRRNYHLFQPLLYQVATAALAPSEIAYPIRAILRRQANASVLLGHVVAVDTAARELVLEDGRLAYDYLVLAVGARDTYFGHDAWEQYAPGLKSLEDALEIRRRILLAFERAEREPDEERRRTLLTFAIVGGGPTGVELAGAIAEIAREVLVRDFRVIDPRSTRVVLIEAGPRILPTFAPSLSAAAARSLAALGVEIRTETPVTDIGDGCVRFAAERLAAGTILWAAGVRATPIGASLGVILARDGRVPVEADLTVAGHPEIFVIGDLASFPQQGRPLPGVAPVAIQQGRHAARNIVRACRGDALLPFHYRDKGNLASIGRASAVAEIGPLRIAGFLAWIVWLFVHIVYLIGFRSRLVVLIEWAWAYVGYERAARLITGDVTWTHAARAGAGTPRPSSAPSSASSQRLRGSPPP